MPNKILHTSNMSARSLLTSRLASPNLVHVVYDYRSRMPATLDGQLTVEKTPSYFVTKSVPHRVYSMSPAAKLIVVVREPVARALSDYTQARLKRPDLPSFEAMAFGNATATADRRPDDGTVNRSWGAIRIGLYARYLDRWLRRFSLDQFHFVSGERLVVDPAGELARLQDFLGVKRLVTDKHFYFNATKGFPCLKKAERGGAPRCLGQSKGRTHPVVNDFVLQRLRHFYRPHNRRFYDMTGIDFGWD